LVSSRSKTERRGLTNLKAILALLFIFFAIHCRTGCANNVPGGYGKAQYPCTPVIVPFLLRVPVGAVPRSNAAFGAQVKLGSRCLAACVDNTKNHARSSRNGARRLDLPCCLALRRSQRLELGITFASLRRNDLHLEVTHLGAENHAQLVHRHFCCLEF